MRKQKRVAVINDVTGFGRCAAAVAQPIISAMKMQCCVLPTAILSVHTGFPDYFLHDFTPYLKEYIDSWYTCFAAGAVLISIPIALLFLKLQKYYVDGMAGAVKG